jgi:hypothetical protein
MSGLLARPVLLEALKLWMAICGVDTAECGSQSVGDCDTPQNQTSSNI